MSVESLDVNTEKMMCKTDKLWIDVMGVLPWLEWMISACLYVRDVCSSVTGELCGGG